MQSRHSAKQAILSGWDISRILRACARYVYKMTIRLSMCSQMKFSKFDRIIVGSKGIPAASIMLEADDFLYSILTSILMLLLKKYFVKITQVRRQQTPEAVSGDTLMPAYPELSLLPKDCSLFVFHSMWMLLVVKQKGKACHTFGVFDPIWI